MVRALRIRFVPKRKDKKWGVYDRDRGSWPGVLTRFGAVRQDMPTEAEAQTEADRLATYYEGQPA